MDRHFETIEEIQKESQAAPQAVTETTFRKIFQLWKTRQTDALQR